MMPATCLLAAVVLGVDVGWQPLPGGGMEYIIQIEPELLEALRRGEVVVSQVPPQVKDVRQYRIVIGRGRLPRITPAAPPQPPETTPAAASSRTNASALPSGGPGPSPLPGSQNPAPGSGTRRLLPGAAGASPEPSGGSGPEPGNKRPSAENPATEPPAAGSPTAFPFAPEKTSPGTGDESPKTPATGLTPRTQPASGKADSPAGLPGHKTTAPSTPQPAEAPASDSKSPSPPISPFEPPQGFGFPAATGQGERSLPPAETDAGKNDSLGTTPPGTDLDRDKAAEMKLPGTQELPPDQKPDPQAQLPPELPADESSLGEEEPPHRLTSFRGLENSKPLPKKKADEPQSDDDQSDDSQDETEASPSDAKEQQPVETGGGSWGWFTLVVMGLFASLSGNVYLGGQLYQQRQHFRQLLASLRGGQDDEQEEDESDLRE